MRFAADVLIRRRDIGRRRTLGIARADLVALVTLRAVIPAIAGSTLGSVMAVLVCARIGHAPSLDFAAATATLAALTTAIASLTPAIYAAHVDPVRVMRTQ